VEEDDRRSEDLVALKVVYRLGKEEGDRCGVTRRKALRRRVSRGGEERSEAASDE
jgi:hypothetical protein